MKYIQLLILLLFCSNIKAENDKYIVSNIASDLLIDADAVVRLYETEIEVFSESKAKEHVLCAITILNKKAANLGSIKEFYDKTININSLNVKIYNKEGKLIKKVKNKEFIDVVARPGYVLLSDDRLKYYEYESDDYPYTVEYEYDKTYSGLQSYKHWFPLSSYNTSLENASLRIDVAKSLKARFRKNNLSSMVQIITNDNSVSYSWNVSNLNSIVSESFSSSFIDKFPNLIVAPTSFEYENFFGDMTTWNSYGKWAYSLIENRDSVDEETKDKILKLVSGIEDKEEIIKKIYQYVQSKTRYVCISLGIGGFQPFLASDVEKTGYGDCKALSNYTKALLKVVGIESFYTIIGAGDMAKILYNDFPSSNQANHIILCVPLKRDTVWLECTSQTSPYNYLGSFSADRYALLVKKDGGELVNTPKYSREDNLKESISEVELLNNGSIKYKVSTKYHSLMFEEIDTYLSISEKKQIEHLQKSISLTNYDIDDYSFRVLNDGKNICGQRNLNLTLKSYIPISNNRVFLPINLLTKRYYNFKNNKDRKTKIVEDECYMINDTITFKIPNYYEVENIPKNENIESKYGYYKSDFSIIDSKIIYSRILAINKGEFPSEEFPDFYDFHKKIRKAELANIVLIKHN